MAKKKKEKPTGPKKEYLNLKQTIFVQNLIRTGSQTNAALLAGYGTKDLSGGGHQVLLSVRKKVPDILDEMGLTLKAGIEKHLVPLLNANTVDIKWDAKDEKFRVFRLEDNGTQSKALDMFFRLHGAYATKDAQLERASEVRAIIVDVPRPRRPELPAAGGNGTNGKAKS